jgi:hypothetical protein
MPQPSLFLLVPLLALSACPLAVAAPNAEYNAFLKQIAAECKPLIIGRDDIGRGISNSGGLGVDPDNYHKFLSYTSRLYRGTLSEPEYRRSLTAFLGAGTYNRKSFDCIAAHLPASPAARK